MDSYNFKVYIFEVLLQINEGDDECDEEENEQVKCLSSLWFYKMYQILHMCP
jgi:hypothetical protein